MKAAYKKTLIMLFIVSQVLFTGCMVAPVVPPVGMLYNKTQAPLDVDVNNTKVGTKRGESSCRTYLGMVAVGDASIQAAAKNGGIKTVQHADYQYMNVFFGIYQRYTTIVYGE